ncbi:class A beta-lactamase [Nonomuraea indica]|uniref:class A beta-lactamase n=1 Tax=Nonomuraea indica TaxID=1581193 RepID=UPI000C7A5604|nr:class A beta-lactamase [Nonomuraea indica]
MQHHPRRTRSIASKLGASVLAVSTAITGAAWTATPASAGVAGVAGVAGTAAVTKAAPDAKIDIRAEFRKLETAYQGHIGAYAIDTGTGRTVGNRAHERFPSNSTFKAILCGAILHKARTTDPGLMERTLKWKATDVVAHSPVTGVKENIENGLTPERLCHATITTSDNTAANVLLKQIGGPAGMTRYYRSLGDPVGRLDRYETELNDWKPGERRDTIMPAFMARDLQKLTVGKALVPEDRSRLIGWMKDSTTGRERILAGLPKGWTVGDKTGTGGVYGTASDLAIAWPPSGAPVIIAVYVRRGVADAQVDNGTIAKATSLLVRGLGHTS